jgi:hypothetical protein
LARFPDVKKIRIVRLPGYDFRLAGAGLPVYCRHGNKILGNIKIFSGVEVLGNPPRSFFRRPAASEADGSYEFY